MFRGMGEKVNIVPMNSTLNRNGGQWSQLESNWKAVLEAEGSIQVKIEPIYIGNSNRPNEFIIYQTINNIPMKPLSLKNTPTGK